MFFIYLETRIFQLLFTRVIVLEDLPVIMASYHCHTGVYDECSTITAYVNIGTFCSMISELQYSLFYMKLNFHSHFTDKVRAALTVVHYMERRDSFIWMLN